MNRRCWALLLLFSALSLNLTSCGKKSSGGGSSTSSIDSTSVVETTTTTTSEEASTTTTSEEVTTTTSVGSSTTTTSTDGSTTTTSVAEIPTRFETLDDETILDPDSELIWTQDADLLNTLNRSEEGTDWINATSFIDYLNDQVYGGYTDWRMATRSEMIAFGGSGLQSEDFPGPFDNIQTTFGYWTSSEDLSHVVDSLIPIADGYSTTQVYGVQTVSMLDGSQGSAPRVGYGGLSVDSTYIYNSVARFVWPVRSQNTERFVNNDDGTITDRDTGLIWVENTNLPAEPEYEFSEDGYITLAEALVFSANLNTIEFAGNARWRLPSFEELDDFARRGILNGDIPGPFQSMLSAQYWTTSEVFSGEEGAGNLNLVVNLEDGLGGTWSGTQKAYAWFVHDSISTMARIGFPDPARPIISGELIDFQGVAKGGKSPYTYLWDFGAAGNSTLKSPPDITFGSAADYQIKFKATDQEGIADSTFIVLTVYDDVDDDGIIDQWEIDNFGNITATDGLIDSDGDGISDFEEYMQGSDPNDATSFPYYVTNPVYNVERFVKLDAAGDVVPDYSTTWVAVEDKNSGLIWEKKTDDGSINDRDRDYDFASAQTSFIANLNTAVFGGFNDWRLPTARELVTILRLDGDIPAINTDYFPNTQPVEHWSSDIFDENTSLAIGFDLGETHYYSMLYDLPIRAVRGPTYTPSFVDNGDGTITDLMTGLMWEIKTDENNAWASDKDRRYSWPEATEYCADLTLAGHEDWRLPTLHELITLVDYGYIDPSVDMTTFPNTVSAEYWTASNDESFHYWYIDFNIGNIKFDILDGSVDYSHYVRAVRVGTPHPYPLVRIDTPESEIMLMAGDSVNFTGTVVQGDPSFEFAWDFDGGATALTVEDPGEVVFATMGNYRVTFTVWDKFGYSDSVFVDVIVAAERFVDNGDETVVDTSTGHIWTQDADAILSEAYNGSGTLKWNDIPALIDTLNAASYAGRSDWRLPTLEEISVLLSDSVSGGLESIFLPGPFVGVAESFYWTATELSTNPNGDAYVVDMRDGATSTSGKNANSYRVWLLAGFPDLDSDSLSDDWEVLYFGNITTTDGTGDTDGDGLSDALEFQYESDPNGPTRWLVNDEETIIDYTYNKMWTRDGNLLETLGWGAGASTPPVLGVAYWDVSFEFVTYLNSINYAGYNNWRMPTRTELMDFVGTFPNGGLAGDYFPGPFENIKFSYWSSTLDANPAFAYYVCLDDGDSSDASVVSGLNYIWLMRDN